MIIELKLQVINNSSVPLNRATSGSAGIDLPAGSCVQEQDGVFYFSTGVQVAIPEGYVGLVVARSSLHKKGWRLTNSVGVIDSDYRGPIMLAMQRGDIYQYPNNYDLVAQLVIVPTPAIEVEEVKSLPETARGLGGFGSTDRKSGVEL